MKSATKNLPIEERLDLARDPETSKFTLIELLHDTNNKVSKAAIWNPSTPPREISWLN